ncbi:MAG: glycosyltransferase [Terrisporobacter sp.]
MRIAMITNNYKPFIGGVPISIERLSKGLEELGHEVFIFAPSYENQIEEHNVIRYKSLKSNNKISSKLVVPNIFDINIEKAFKELEIDVIHVHHPMLTGWTALYLGKKYNVPVTFTYHTRYDEYLHNIKFYEVLENRSKNIDDGIIKNIELEIMNFTKNKLVPKGISGFANKCGVVYAPTELIKTYLEDIGVKSKIKVMPTGLEKEYFVGDKEISEGIRNRYKGNKKHLFCTVSRLEKEKNIEFLINGLKLLKDKVGDSFKILIIGEGQLKEQLIDKVNKLRLESNVEFLNNIPNGEIGNYYRACDLFLFASKSETQGIVLIEAMAAENPVVAIEATGVVDIVKNNVNGYMTSENLEEWCDKIAYLMNNKNVMDEMKVGAYKTALNYLNTKVAKIAEENYRKAINEYNKEGQVYEYEVKVRSAYR